MQYNLIDSEDVSAKKLLSLLQSAYIDAKLPGENAIVIRMMNDIFILLVEKNRICLYKHSHGYITDNDVSIQKVLTKAMQLNSTYALCRCIQVFQNDDKGLEVELQISYETRFSKGLNFHQLIDDIHFFVDIQKDITREFAEFLIENNLLIDR